MKSGYSGWAGVKKLAEELDYSWFDVCDILWRAKHHKQPETRDILLFSVIIFLVLICKNLVILVGGSLHSGQSSFKLSFIFVCPFLQILLLRPFL